MPGVLRLSDKPKKIPVTPTRPAVAHSCFLIRALGRRNARGEGRGRGVPPRDLAAAAAAADGAIEAQRSTGPTIEPCFDASCYVYDA